MPTRLVVHVGLMKTATTYMQRLLDLNASTLAERGVLWPGSRLMFAAAADLLGPADGPHAGSGSWDSLISQVRGHDGVALLSNELLSIRRRQKLLPMVAELPDLEVVITARDLVRVIPSQWRTGQENKLTTPWPDFIAALTADDHEQFPVRWFWRRQDLPAIIRIWRRLAGPDRVTVITVPPAGAAPEVIAERFLGFLGVDPAGLDFAVDMTYAFPQAPLPSMTDHQKAWARRRAAELAAKVEESGVTVVGELSDLAPA